MRRIVYIILSIWDVSYVFVKAYFIGGKKIFKISQPCIDAHFQVAMATGQVLFQRFYYSKSFVRHPMETTAMGCVCLASKIEEAPRRIRDVINVFHHIKQVTSGK